jgi:hypothetical protein
VRYGWSHSIPSGPGARIAAEPGSDERRYLLVAHHRVAADVLVRRMDDLIGEALAVCHVVVPATPTDTRLWTWDEDEAQRSAANRLAQVLAGLRRIGVNATGEVGDSGVADAVDDARRGRGVDEVILALPPA